MTKGCRESRICQAVFAVADSARVLAKVPSAGVPDGREQLDRATRTQGILGVDVSLAVDVSWDVSVNVFTGT